MSAETVYDYSLEFDQPYQPPQLDRRFPNGARVLLRKLPDKDPGVVLRIHQEKIVVRWPDRDERCEPQDLMLDHGCCTFDDEEM